MPPVIYPTLERPSQITMQISLSDHFTYPKLIRFVMPSILMMIFTSIYGVVDGLFVSNFVGKTPFAAVNLIFPLFIVLGALGFMMGTGGTAIVAKTLGEGKRELANRYFSLLVYATFIGGVAITILGFVFLRPVAVLLGAEGEMLDNCVTYGSFLLPGMPFFMLQNLFQSFFITAEKPKLGLFVTVAAGCTNMVLDVLLVGVISLGLPGAALATSISQMVGGVLPLFYFAAKNTSLLRLGRTSFYGRMLAFTCVNGSSELMSNIAASVITMLYNFKLLEIAGEDGVAAYGVVMYVSFIFAAIFIGYAIGSAPLISYNYGAQNQAEMKNLFRKSGILMASLGIVMTALAILLAGPLSAIFVGYNDSLLALTANGMTIYAVSFLFSGFNIFGSSLFTALNNGQISAVISFLRSLIFPGVLIMILPALLGMNGIWLTAVTTDALAFAVTAAFVIFNRKRYRYM